MELAPHDLHLVLDAQSRSGKLFAEGGHLLLSVEARNRTVLDNGNYGHWSPCPPGSFILGAPIPKNTVPFGPWFVGLTDYGPNTAMADHNRAGIGCHGGGSGLPHPFAPRQGWQITEGCFRLQNEDLELLVHQIRASQGVGGKCYCTVVAPQPGAANSLDEDYAPLPAEGLFPGE